MRIVGDVHGKIKQYNKIADGVSSVQVGDMGFGFCSVTIPENGYFIRGNHDSPFLARKHPAYLGDFGVKEIDGIRFFFVSGAWSIDKALRIEGRSWWPDEELSVQELELAVDAYKAEKPDIVITHDCPSPAAAEILKEYSLTGDPNVIPTRTGQALSAMFEVHQPKFWIFGHYHCDKVINIGQTEFVCLNELAFLDV
jgi:hypothetical protein